MKRALNYAIIGALFAALFVPLMIAFFIKELDNDKKIPCAKEAQLGDKLAACYWGAVYADLDDKLDVLSPARQVSAAQDRRP